MQLKAILYSSFITLEVVYNKTLHSKKCAIIKKIWYMPRDLLNDFSPISKLLCGYQTSQILVIAT